MNTPRLSAQDLRASAEVHRELGPQYSDAVLDSFLEKLEGRLEQHLAQSPPARNQPPTKEQWDRRRNLSTGIAVGGGVVGIPLSLLGYASASPYSENAHSIWSAILAASIGSGIAGFIRLRRHRD